ncbi:Phospholipid phosphatase-related protein type 4 [Amphibalanus amphitrite]|uniref:Phospholipid phosphatase-related protein type 4 n=1 Tax=Amphibalanus amphitrite TaxID=1232801 RepID=A0A6A4WNB6_AMPAM|nr:Phospholipid phosphatase-related protein type 4 [Amphibalanus amphitrite]
MGEYESNNLLVPLFLLETVVTGCLAVIFYYLKYLDNFKDRRYPLPCTDIQWISYPYYQDTKGLPLSMTDPGLYTACFFIPTLIVIFFEIIHWFFYQGSKKAIVAACPNWTFHFFTRRVIRIVGTLLFGYFLTTVLVFTLKYMFAVPRPHFLAACQPNATALYIACGGDIYTDHLNTSAMFLPSETICQAGPRALTDALQSFPSEHGALAAFCGVFLAAYMHRMTSFRRLVTPRPLLVFLSLLGGVTPGIGSLNAFQVRWADLLVGYLIGTLVAVYLTQVSLAQFATERHPAPPLQTVATLAGGPQSQAALSFGTQGDAAVLFHSPGLDRDGPPSIPRANPNSPVKVTEVSNRASFVEPSGSYTNRAYLGPRVLPRRAY